MKNWNKSIMQLYTCVGLFGLILNTVVVSNEFNCPIECICTELGVWNFTHDTSMYDIDDKCFTNRWSLSLKTEWDTQTQAKSVVNKKYKLLHISCNHLPPSSDFLNLTVLGFDVADRIVFSTCSSDLGNYDNSKNLDEIMKQINIKPENLVTLNFQEDTYTQWDIDAISFINVLELFIDHNEPKLIKANILLDISQKEFDCTNRIIPFLFNEYDTGHFKLGINYLTDVYIDVILSTLMNYFPKMYEVSLPGNDLQELKVLNSEDCFMPRQIDVSKNNIKRIDESILQYLWRTNYAENPSENLFEDYSIEIFLGENPIDCGCHLYPFLGHFHSEHGSAIDVSETTCYTPKEMRYTKLEYLHAHNYTCHLINEDSNHDDPCSKTVGCICTFTPIDNATTVDCSSKAFTELPNLSYMESYRHVTLNMEDNRLSKVVLNGTLPELQNLRYLKLGMNAITKFHVISLPPNLKVLELHENELTDLDARTLDILAKANIDNITLHDNPWRCDCSAINLIALIEAKVTYSKNSRRIRCHPTGVSLLSLSKTTLCPDYDSIIIFGILVAIIGLCLGSIIAVYYRFRKKIRLWLWSKSICVTSFEEDDDDDWMYDIFISYSHKDEDFVVQELMPKLESGPKPYKVCVHFRDWLVGEYIPVQIERSVQKSKWTILIVSQQFLTSVWGRLEFQTAHRQALNKRKSRIIVILYGDIDNVEDLDAELKAYINMSMTIKWGDPSFWEKLENLL